MPKGIFTLLLLLSFSFAVSIDVEVESESCPDTLNFIEVLYNLPSCIVEEFFSTLIGGFVYSTREFLENSLSFIVEGPDIHLFCTAYGRVMRIIESLYTIALMGVGTYYILSSTDPEKRANAKFWIQNIIFMIIALTFSFSIFEMILELNHYITASIYSESFADLLTIESTFTSLVFALVLSFFFMFAGILTFITLLIRYIMIPFLLLLFPFAIFLYFIPFSKEWGSFILKFILVIIFMTSIDAIIVLGMSYLLSSGDPLISEGFVHGMTLMLGFGMIGFVNIIIYFIAVISLLLALAGVLKSALSVGWKIALLARLL